ncbi:tRNA (5-methylaminomethyl-2-thiouridine)(34)-methyltransferase MnmD [Roseitranquillus sediminis]|uniref:tRNA (5-methylaminomethyl-2-thiouridine)(34)-methyltransferase MnmD n=1 Tax=Roseitranquillus sediminis TaxID=2809051 RepID=UPI001D0C9885|nr:tRNA (5-methylaminomethyl-2-thiouridine)(34)-methyltransferase MnmD [Roseitranquillus sediminis]MBM9593729.1 tRNA (5-methylaminomethyl-2-thiouridine)(34)-methyltransferase MnmD [Roseitranquillus sediminis]
MTDQTAGLGWTAGGVPVSTRFDDPYFSLEDGLAEARHVFLRGNGLPGRFRPGFRIGELGFGTGLNVLAAWRAWLDADLGGPLEVTSFEAWPLTADAMETALAAFPELAPLASELTTAWRAGRRMIETPTLRLTVIVGDARRTVGAWDGQVDAWFLDGFAPARNPELWETALMREVARHTAPGGTAATYSAAGAVRRALTEAGFSVERRAGFGRKRHMTVAHL